MLTNLWFNAHEIGFAACEAQMFLIQTSQEWNLLSPYQWPLTAMTAWVLSEIGLAVALSAVMLTLPMASLIHHLPFCDACMIAHKTVSTWALPSWLMPIFESMPSSISSLHPSLSSSWFWLESPMVTKSVHILPQIPKYPHKALSTCGSHTAVKSVIYASSLFPFICYKCAVLMKVVNNRGNSAGCMGTLYSLPIIL